MRTLIDVSLFVHTRRAWHGKQYFTLATIVVAWSVSHSLAPSLSLSIPLLFPSPFSPRPIWGPPYRLVSLAFTRLSLHLSLALDTHGGPKGGPVKPPLGISSPSVPATPRHATNGRIIRATCPLPSSSPLVLRSSTCTKGGGGAKLESERPLV